MPMKMEITSIEDIDHDSTQGKESRESEKGDSSGSDGREMVEGELHDALDEFPSENEENLKKKPSQKQPQKQQKIMKWIKKALLRLRNGGKIEVEVNLTKKNPKLETKLGDLKEINGQQEKETKPETELGLESEHTPKFENKDHFVKGVNAKDCIKDKVT